MSGDLRATLAAEKALRDLNVDTSKRVDIYDAIDKAGLFLVFAHLEGILGLSLPALSGIMITMSRSPAIQRYTAAHELGHCILHSDELMILDDEYKIESDRPETAERQAQLFAAAFLMPPDLILEVANEYSIRPGHTRPVAIGRAARHMGTSYEATVRRFVDLGRLAVSDQGRLIQGRRRWRREELFGVQPTRGVGDVWGVEASHGPVHLKVRAGDQVTFNLPENRTTGYQWTTDLPAGSSLVGDDFRLPKQEVDGVWVGQQGERLVSVRPDIDGETHVQWKLRRPFDPGNTVATFDVRLQVLPSALEERRRQILATSVDDAALKG